MSLGCANIGPMEMWVKVDHMDDERLARIFLRAAYGFEDDDMVECGIDYLLDAGQCRRIAAFLMRKLPQKDQ
jgi:hypothetical protein